MLQGSAVASLFAYRLGETLDPVVHGVTSDGALAIVAVPAGRWAAEPFGRSVDIRLDLVKKSLDPRVSMVVASGHALGTMVWASAAEADRYVAERQLPSLLVQSLDVPGARLGFVELDRFVLHDLSGAVVVPHSDLPLADPVLGEELAGTGLVAACDTSALKDLCWAVMVGHVPGTVVRKPHPGNACAHTLNMVFCADVDALGVTVMLVTANEFVVVHALFAGPANSLAGLRAQVARLLEDSSPARSERI